MQVESSTRRVGIAAIHSVNRFVFSVPDIAEAERFYTEFGLDPRRDGERINLHAHGHPHCWATIHANRAPKQLQYMSFGIFEEDREAFRLRIASAGLNCASHPLSDGSGLWLRDPDGLPNQLVVAPKVSPSVKSPPVSIAPARDPAAAPMRSKVAKVRPRWLSHVLRFSPDVPRMIRFSEDMLGVRLSDKSADVVAFMHGAHGSDHHLIAFAKSDKPGLHHSSWDVGSLHDVGMGAEQMRMAGYKAGWGLGRHVLGSNYFYYARDPWGSYAEYSFDIDFVAPDRPWQAGDYPPEDSFYLWGPDVPEDFVTNFEPAQAQAAA